VVTAIRLFFSFRIFDRKFSFLFWPFPAADQLSFRHIGTLLLARYQRGFDAVFAKLLWPLWPLLTSLFFSAGARGEPGRTGATGATGSRSAVPGIPKVTTTTVGPKVRTACIGIGPIGEHHIAVTVFVTSAQSNLAIAESRRHHLANKPTRIVGTAELIKKITLGLEPQ